LAAVPEHDDADAPWVHPMLAWIFHPQAADLAGMVEDHTSGCVAGVEGQRDIHNGMPAGPPRRRVSCALEAAAKAGHAGPRACDLIRIRVPAQARVEFQARPLPAAVTIPQNANVTCPAQGQVADGGGLTCGCKLVFSGTDVISPTTVLLAIIGYALFVTLVAIIAFGVGAIVRHTAGAIAIAALFIIPVLEQVLPNEWRWDIMRFLPDAANRVVSVTIGNNADPHLWAAWPQLGVTALWAAALLAAGAYLFRKRDA
jgi:hypothetical protein